MPKKILFVTMCCIIMLAGTAMASVPTSELSIGGIGIGSSGNYVRSVYGNPDNIKLYDWGESWTYGSFELVLEKNAVLSLRSTGNNGLATPAGLAVGMKYSDAYNLYGKADSQGNAQTEIVRHPKGCDYHYIYFSSNDMLMILYTKNNVIKTIYIVKGH